MLVYIFYVNNEGNSNNVDPARAGLSRPLAPLPKHGPILSSPATRSATWLLIGRPIPVLCGDWSAGRRAEVALEKEEGEGEEEK